MADLGATRTNIKYASKALLEAERQSIFSRVTNKDFETPGNSDPVSSKAITRKNQEFVITQLIGAGWKTSSGTPSYTKIKEVISRLVIDQKIDLNEEIESIAKFASMVNDPEGTIIKQSGISLAEQLDKALIALYGDAASGNWYGTSYATGTVTVTVTTGAVVGSGTTFAAGMVGKPFKAVGHDKWYRVKTFTDTTHIVIEDDSDDLTSAYTGGAIAGGTAYEIQANAVASLTQNNVIEWLNTLSAMLTSKNVPMGNRWIALPALATQPVIMKAEREFSGVEKVHDKNFERGEIYKAGGFLMYFLPDEWFTGNNTTGFYIPGGHSNWITGDFNYIEAPHVIEAKDIHDSYSNFIKGLLMYGLKVADGRRKYGTTSFVKFSIS